MIVITASRACVGLIAKKRADKLSQRRRRRTGFLVIVKALIAGPCEKRGEIITRLITSEASLDRPPSRDSGLTTSSATVARASQRPLKTAASA